MDTFRAANEIATIKASANRALGHIGQPPADPQEGDVRGHLHYRAHKAVAVALDRIEQARIAIERLEQMEVV